MTSTMMMTDHQTISKMSFDDKRNAFPFTFISTMTISMKFFLLYNLYPLSKWQILVNHYLCSSLSEYIHKICRHKKLLSFKKVKLWNIWHYHKISSSNYPHWFHYFTVSTKLILERVKKLFSFWCVKWS